MAYSEVWAGVLCATCARPLLVYNETVWKELIAHVSQSALREAGHVVACSNPDCAERHSYRPEQFLHFRVEQITEPR